MGSKKGRTTRLQGLSLCILFHQQKGFIFAKSEDIQGADAVVLVAVAVVVVAVLVARQEFVSELSYWAAS